MVLEEVEKLKQEGNALFSSQEWLKSASKYTQAIKLDPSNAVLYSNRSAALLKLLKVTKAIEDADMCIKLRPEWEKGYFRKGAVMEEQNKLSKAMEVYQVALKLVPDSKELSQKIHSLRNQISKQAKSAKLAAAVDPSSGTNNSKEGSQDTSSRDASSKAKARDAGGKDAGTKGGSKEGSTSKQAKAPSDPAQGADGSEVVYDDLGSEDVAKFAEEYLGVLRDDIQDGTVIPTVHFLPGRKLASSEEQEAHVRIAGAFETPDTLASLTQFLRQKGLDLQAKAMLAVVPKAAVAFPRVWDKPKWPGGERQGVFAQLETPTVRKLWFIPTQAKKAETPVAADFDRFSLLPRLLKS